MKNKNINSLDYINKIVTNLECKNNELISKQNNLTESIASKKSNRSINKLKKELLTEKKALYTLLERIGAKLNLPLNSSTPPNLAIDIIKQKLSEPSSSEKEGDNFIARTIELDINMQKFCVVLNRAIDDINKLQEKSTKLLDIKNKNQHSSIDKRILLDTNIIKQALKFRNQADALCNLLLWPINSSITVEKLGFQLKTMVDQIKNGELPSAQIIDNVLEKYHKDEMNYLPTITSIIQETLVELNRLFKYSRQAPDSHVAEQYLNQYNDKINHYFNVFTLPRVPMNKRAESVINFLQTKLAQINNREVLDEVFIKNTLDDIKINYAMVDFYEEKGFEGMSPFSLVESRIKATMEVDNFINRLLNEDEPHPLDNSPQKCAIPFKSTNDIHFFSKKNKSSGSAIPNQHPSIAWIGAFEVPKSLGANTPKSNSTLNIDAKIFQPGTGFN